MAGGVRLGRSCGFGRRLAVVAAAEADLGETLQQRQTLLLRTSIRRRLSLPGAELVLRRQQQLIETWHARGTHLLQAPAG